ncbi:ATP-binding protein [Streptomyces sp. A0642]|uniref:ATP-binding protein n=1 Tax=Streptomyces sp. A0642 TaxID=2563100 RepID=UPI0010A297A5|nr:ATP-binding protein [Streptomyces sp. A0642]THA73456.1 ATP-binding protein [Streptomyces sp. A0642]
MNSTQTAVASTHSVSTVVRGADPSSIRRAREAARAFVVSLVPAVDRTAGDSLVLVVSELVTNALRHGGGRYAMALSATDDVVTVEVSDPSPVPPRERAPDLNGGSGGFGWHMVRHLTTGLTVIRGPDTGKTIRAQVPRAPRSAPGTG